MPHGHGEDRPDTRSEKQCFSVINIDWSLGEASSMYIPISIIVICMSDCYCSYHRISLPLLHKRDWLQPSTAGSEVDGASVRTASHNRLQLSRLGLPGGVSF